MDRRRFLSAVAMSAVISPLLPLSSWSASQLHTLSRRHEALISAVPYINGASVLANAIPALGQRYLRRHPEEADRDVLMPLICGRNVPLARTLRTSARARSIARHLDAQIRADFAQGRTAGVDGWILSRTEARLYALAALS